MILQSAWQKSFGFLGSKPIVVEPVEEHLTSDAGLLPIRQFDEQIGLTAQFAAALRDLRYRPFIDHSFAEMARMRVYGILAGYADQNDHDQLRYDPVFKLLAGRQPSDDELASQPTLSRFENAINIASLWRLRDVFMDQFLASFAAPPRRLTFDIDTFDDPTHGEQQLTFFHGYYEQYQYQPRLITCAQNDLVVMACLLHGTAHAALGADDDLEYLVGRLREKWPDVVIELRGDSGMAVPAMYDVCERLGVQYTFGLRLNPVLQRQSESLLAEAIEGYEQTGQPQRLFTAFWYQAGSWAERRWVVVKAEAHAAGTNRRAVVTNRPGAHVLPQAAYEAYADRGESENRNKEMKCGFEADRLSDHRYLANLFRLYLHVAALNLLVRLRRHVADPPPENPAAELPREALAGYARRRFFNQRRDRDPLGEGHACTWRMRLIKVAARVIETTRRIVVQLSGSWPHLDHYRRVSQQILDRSQPATDSG
ncbi:MAG: IS1380 family transposase [Gemmatimonadales bacterium]